MPSKVDQLLAKYELVVNEPWSSSLSGQERIWFLVYDPAEQRKVDLRLGDFETATIKAGKKWAEISLKKCFPTWMAAQAYRDSYFQSPQYIVEQLEGDFKTFAIDYLKKKIANKSTDSDTVIVIKDVSSLFGFIRLSEILKSCDKVFTGRMLIFFPGEFERNQYRLLDARDGWDYLARPITL
ncbi:MAG: DUF1788 domain-containing protein [Bacteroidales bacterium]|nr:DUF1788 domain-containing protein [Bacteroidales bacterium]MDD2612014.1 DUF1788 domain-containing protein [Bacteroidales bacterium]